MRDIYDSRRDRKRYPDSYANAVLRWTVRGKSRVCRARRLRRSVFHGPAGHCHVCILYGSVHRALCGALCRRFHRHDARLAVDPLYLGDHGLFGLCAGALFHGRDVCACYTGAQGCGLAAADA